MRRHAVRLPVVATTEAIATVRSALWPVARWIHPLPRPSAPVGNRPAVVLVHGYLGHPDMFRPLIRRMRVSGFPVVETVGYPSTRLRLDEIAARIDAVARPLAERYGPVDLVGHSLGAVASRCWLKVFGGHEVVRRFVSLGGPHAGTAMWRLTPPTLWDVLDPDGPWVHRLNQEPEPVPTLVIRSAYDHQVLPPIRAALPGTDEVVLEGYGHNGLLWARAAHLEVIRGLS